MAQIQRRAYAPSELVPLINTYPRGKPRGYGAYATLELSVTELPLTSDTTLTPSVTSGSYGPN